MVRRGVRVPDESLVRAYLEAGSTKAAAVRLGIPAAAYRHRLARLYERRGARNMGELVWMMRDCLDGAEVPPGGVPSGAAVAENGRVSERAILSSPGGGRVPPAAAPRGEAGVEHGPDA